MLLTDIAFSSTSRLSSCLRPRRRCVSENDLESWVNFTKPIASGTLPLQHLLSNTQCPVSVKIHQRSVPPADCTSLLTVSQLEPLPSLEVFQATGERGRVYKHSLFGSRSPLYLLTSFHSSPLLQHHQVKNTKMSLWALLYSDFTLCFLL